MDVGVGLYVGFQADEQRAARSEKGEEERGAG